MNEGLVTSRFPRAAKYHPDWIASSASGGANSLWLAEWLAEALDLQAGMRVLDLGCGRAASSIFLQREFGVLVWAADLWFDPSENLQRIRDTDAEHGVYPLRADARALPFANEFFDAVVSIDSFVYYGTDDLYLSYLARFLKPGGLIGIAGAGLVQEFDAEVPEHLRAWWTPAHACLHSAEWWRAHWERSGIVDVAVADTLDDGWQYWLAWQRAIAPDNAREIAALEDDGGSHLGYVRVVAGRRSDVQLDEPITAIPAQYSKHPLLR
jgi:cyclopropane fatty-acyl-phospholipid synthase-like methyltransferase